MDREIFKNGKQAEYRQRKTEKSPERKHNRKQTGKAVSSRTQVNSLESPFFLSRHHFFLSQKLSKPNLVFVTYKHIHTYW